MRVVIKPEYQKYDKEFRSIPEWIAEGKGESIHEGRNIIRRFIIQGQPFMVKRFKRVNWIQSFIYSLFRKTKAEHAFIYAKAYRERGIDTPEEVAFIETHNCCGWFRDGYFISLVSPYPPVCPLAEQTDQFDNQLVNDLAGMMVRMHRAGILNKDLNLGNFLYHKESGEYHFTMVDINRTQLVNGIPDREKRLENLCTITCKQDLFRLILDSYLALTENGNNSKEKLAGTGMHYWEKRLRKLQTKSKFKSIIKRFK